jgi:hypothetical protein
MKIAIVGAHEASMGLAPYDDKSWLIWPYSPSTAGKVRRVDAWHELHAVAWLANERNTSWVRPYCEYMRSLTVPVFMQGPNALVPNAVAFPKDALVERFGNEFFTSTAAWLLAKAITEQPEEIGIYGIDMSCDGEYAYERPGCHYFIKTARGLGIKVTIPPQSDLDVATPLYGYGDANPASIKMAEHACELRERITGMDQRITALETERNQLMLDRQHLRGALEQNIYMRRTWLAWSGPDL